MKKIILGIGLGLALTGCGSSEGAIDTAENAAKTYCEKSNESRTSSGADKLKLNRELKDLENKIEAEHEGDEAWFEEFETKVEEMCEAG